MQIKHNVEVDTLKGLLKDSKDLLILCSLLDKSGQCIAQAHKIDKYLNGSTKDINLKDLQ